MDNFVNTDEIRVDEQYMFDNVICDEGYSGYLLVTQLITNECIHRQYNKGVF